MEEKCAVRSLYRFARPRSAGPTVDIYGGKVEWMFCCVEEARRKSSVLNAAQCQRRSRCRQQRGRRLNESSAPAICWRLRKQLSSSRRDARNVSCLVECLRAGR